MTKRNQMNPAATPANAAARNANQTTTTEFASETNVAQVRKQNQQSAARAQQQNNVTE